MKNKIIDFIEKKKTGYEVHLNDEVLIIEPELKIKYHLTLGMEIDLKTYNLLIDENEFSTFYRMCISTLKKMQTRYELKAMMESKGAKQKIIKQVLSKLEEKKYIDDEEYTKIYIQMKSSSKGPKMLEYELRKKGISPDLITKHLSLIDEQEAISHLLKKKMTSLKTKSKQQKILSLKSYLFSKGFDRSAIEKELFSISFDDDQELLNLAKDYQKLLYKYQHLDLYQKNQQIYQRLYQKGYLSTDIKKIMNQELEL
jgi:regulatory protein